MTRRPILFCLCALALAMAGCAGYRLGPTNGQLAGARSIQISPPVNHTLEPRLPEYVMNSLRKNLQQDGTYRLDTHDDGDIILNAVIISYQRVGLSVEPTDVITAVVYQINMTVQVTARDRVTGKILVDKAVKGQTTLRAGNDLASAERQAIPLLTDDFAKRATSLLVDGTW
jgi:hypothetical protein